VTNLRYVDDIILLASSEAQLQELVDQRDSVGKKYTTLKDIDKTSRAPTIPLLMPIPDTTIL